MNTPDRKGAATFTNGTASEALNAVESALDVPQEAAFTLDESEASYRYLFESNPHPMWIYDCKTLAFLLVNDAAIEHYGYSQQEFLAMTIKDIRPSEDIPSLVAGTLPSRRNGGKCGVWRHRRKNGEFIEVEITVHDFQFRGRSARLALIGDITERRRAEQAVRHIMEGAQCLLWYALVEDQPDGLKWSTATLDETAAQKFFPIMQREGQSYAEALVSSRLPEDNVAVTARGTKALRGGETSYTQHFRCLRADGEWRWLSETIHIEVVAPGRWQCVGVCTDINEQKRSEAELEARVVERTAQITEANVQLTAAKQEADAANQAKSEFLSRMSHELRTPLNAILGFGQILEKHSLTPLQEESVQHILKGGRHLLDLINEVLDIARVEAGHLDLSLEPIALAEILAEACSLVRPLAAEREIHIDIRAAALERTHVQADRQRLKQVLINLLSNAIKYNKTGGKVTLHSLPIAEDRLRIAVQDTGPGIAPQQQQKLFTPFERLDAAHAGIEGTGLGLVLSQRLVSAMGGELTFESVPGEGSTFCIDLPTALSPQERVADQLHGMQREEAGSTGQPSATILTIEDNLSNLRLMEVLLRSRPGTTLLAAMQGSIGLDLARQHEPDLILLDLNLPDISGKEVLARLQASALTCDIPVVVLSADATPAQIERLLKAGAKAYLTKPLDVTEFLHTLDAILPNNPVDDSIAQEILI